MSLAAGPDADASRPRSGILTPTSDGSTHDQDAVRSSVGSSQAMYHDHDALLRLLREPITVKPHPVDLHVKPRKFQPLMLVARKYFPLSYLDLFNPSGDLPRSRLFESRIKILDLEGRTGTSSSVLIARAESDGSVFALESHSPGLFTLCKLGSWVKLEELAHKATATLSDKLQSSNSTTSGIERQPEPDTSGKPIIREHRKKRAAIEAIQTLVRKRPRSVSVAEDITIKAEPTETPTLSELTPRNDASEVQSNTGQPSISLTPKPALQDPAQTVAQQHSLDIILETLRTQYFEALYKSMGSLAYFTKGPLSRARTTFHLDLEANLDMASLIDFLKSLLLTTIQIDKKYRETVPDLFSKTSPVLDSSDEGRKRKKRAKKMKVGKDGLYPSEHKMLQQWWVANKPEIKEGQSTEGNADARAFASRLRTRETQLQMILILEIMALEPLKAVEDALPGLPETTSMGPPTLKKRNKHNLPVMLDVHADRLTIWQSTADDHAWSADSQDSPSAAAGTEQKASSEPLRDFCTDIIVPFFSARLPQQCDAINRKLGGPMIISPPKSKSSRSKSAQKSQKPGAVARRQVPVKPERTLQRALSTDLQSRRSVSRGPSNAIALMRSASSTTLMGNKRDISETPGSHDTEQDRSNSSGLSRRSSGGVLSDPRAQKKAVVEAELRDAISALRKPNRQVVSKAMAEAADFKATAAAQSAKKVRRPVKSSSLPSVQVHATPVNNRFKDVLASRSENTVELAHLPSPNLIPPSSIGQNVPSTARKVAQYPSLVAASPFSQSLDVIGSSPVKSSRTSNFLLRPAGDIAIPPSSPSKAPATPPRTSIRNSEGAGGLGLSHCRDVKLGTTPVKDTPLRPAAPTIVAADLEKAEPKAASIYQQLGWDDDFDDL